MTLTFPDHFIFGTSTSAYQIETAVDHDWCNVTSRDGHRFLRTTDHEQRFREDVAIIASLAPHYRMSLMWSKLQREPLAAFDPHAKAHYHALLTALRNRHVTLMLVIHHFANPVWFMQRGGWTKSKNIALWVDFATKLVDEYGHYVTLWNTFNEPNLYTSLSYALGQFPPYRKNIYKALQVIRNMGAAHNIVYDYIKDKHPDAQVGISHNTAVFSAQNALGVLPAQLADYWYMQYLPSHFTKSDFTGISYYARIAHDPGPITQLYTPGKIHRYNKAHDAIWEYYPEGLYENLQRFWKVFRKPLIITENGFCANDDSRRIQSLYDYMQQLHRALGNKIDVRGYYHWSTWDNFEWTLGPTYRFGLYSCNPETMERTPKPSAEVFSKLAYTRSIEIRK